MPLRLGYKASAEQFGPVELAGFAVRAEQAGFDSVFISDHLQPWRHDGGHAPAALPWLGAVGARTERVLLGTSVLTPTFRYHPAVIAQAFATLGVLYPGRVILGVGSGESLNEVPLGLEWPDGKERFARLKEAVTLIRELWTGERVIVRGHLLPHGQGHHLRPARGPGADLHRRLRAGRDQVGRPGRGRVHHHLGQGAVAVLRHPAARPGRGCRRRPAEPWTTSTC